MEWQPISTAPKKPASISPQSEWHNGREHGPVILVGFTYAPEWPAHVGWWEPSTRCWRFLEDDGPNDMQPDVWMPLPEAPK